MVILMKLVIRMIFSGYEFGKNTTTQNPPIRNQTDRFFLLRFLSIHSTSRDGWVELGIGQDSFSSWKVLIMRKQRIVHAPCDSSSTNKGLAVGPRVDYI